MNITNVSRGPDLPIGRPDGTTKPLAPKRSQDGDQDNGAIGDRPVVASTPNPAQTGRLNIIA